MALLKADPEPVEIDLSKTALIVVDMQNAFARKGGMLDLFGADISGSGAVIEMNRALLDAARRAAVKVVFLQIGYKPDLSNSGGPDSPNWHKELALLLMRRRPELKGKVLCEGTWDFDIVEELKPLPGETVVVKTRYSGFCGTQLDSSLRTSGAKYLIFTGIATNVCVESTIRDAFFLEYWPIVVSDAVMQAGPQTLQEASLHNIKTFFGWVTTTASLIEALKIR